MISICCGAAGLFSRSGALQRERGVVDDGQRIFDLMREFGGQPAGGAQLPFARGEFARLLRGEPLAFQQQFQAGTTDRREQQHDHAAGRTAGPNLRASSNPARAG